MADVDLLDRSTFVTRFGANDVREPVLGRLHILLSSQPEADPDAVIEWLEDVVGWVFERGHVPSRRDHEAERDARLRVLLEVFDEVPATRDSIRRVLGELIARLSSARLFGSVGLPRHTGLLREVVARVGDNVMPAAPVGNDLARLLERLFRRRSSVDWFLGLPQMVRTRLERALGFDSAGVNAMMTRGAKEAALTLAAQVSALGLYPLIQQASGVSPTESPFVRLTSEVVALVKGIGPVGPVDACIEDCREVLRLVHDVLDETGISLGLVFDLERARVSLARLSRLASVLSGDEARCDVAWTQLERELITGLVEQRSLASLWKSTTTLLARRIAERTSDSGEHYLTISRAEQHAMFDSAAGGGAITGLLVLLKLFIYWAQLPLLLDSLAIGLNYAWGFVAMQFAHFSLATKQPSMTAATLARGIEERQGTAEASLEPLVDMVARASRTQLAALVGNVGMVIPVVVLIDFIAQLVVGRHVLDAETAQRIVKVHHPFTSGTLVFAAATGVCLWLASIMSGAVENWFVVNEFAGALASNRVLRRLVGRDRARVFSERLMGQVAAFGGNAGFGLLLGFMPLGFKLIGVPMDVRHVTFVMGQLTYAGMFHGSTVLEVSGFGWALLAVPIVASINFAVSFALALVVALRSRGLGVRAQVSLGAAVFKRLMKEPKAFFLAPKDHHVKP
jgi:site-specific recombinase